jgi:hypothetical protein
MEISDNLVIIVAIASLTILESINIILNRQDGAIMLTIASTISGLAGYKIGKVRGAKNE